LRIWVEETTLSQDEEYVVKVELKNQSGTDKEIAYYTHSADLVWPYIDDWWYSPSITEPGGALFQTIANGEHYHRIFRLSCSGWVPSVGYFGFLPKGNYELRFCARFYLNLDSDNQQYIVILSNAVEITVI